MITKGSTISMLGKRNDHSIYNPIIASYLNNLDFILVEVYNFSPCISYFPNSFTFVLLSFLNCKQRYLLTEKKIQIKDGI